MVTRAYRTLFARLPGTRVGDDLLEADKSSVEVMNSPTR
jgi:hypothetical protein